MNKYLYNDVMEDPEDDTMDLDDEIASMRGFYSEFSDDDSSDEMETVQHQSENVDDGTADVNKNNNSEKTITKDGMLKYFRDQLKLPEYRRIDSVEFEYDGVQYECVPMLEINPNKFVMKVLPSNKLKSFLLSNIKAAKRD